MLAKLHTAATAIWSGVAGGAAAGFVARDALGLRQPLIALAWTLGAALAMVALTPRCPWSRRGPLARRRSPGPGSSERGQATVEFAMLVLLAALAFGALTAIAPRFDGRSFGGFLAFRIACTVQRDCHEGDGALVSAYGGRDAALVRELAPNLVYEPGERQLPVDWRRCRRRACAEAPDEPDLDVHRTEAGERATAFTRVVRRDGRTYVQYWLYYPDSTTAWAGSDRLWDFVWQRAEGHGLVPSAPAYPGSHADDWEAYVVRLDRRGRIWARASSHGHWQTCKERRCRDDWTARTGWTRVSRGSHAGHIPIHQELRGVPSRNNPGRSLLPGAARPELHVVPLLPGHDLSERTTTGEGLRLVPLETLDKGDYEPLDDDIPPPWRKEAYRDPESDES